MWTRRGTWAGLAAALLALSAVEGAAQPAALTLHLTTNQSVFGPGTTLTANVGVTYTGAPVTVDLLFGVILPDGNTVVGFGPGMQARAGRVSRLSSLPTFYAGLTLGAGVDVVVPDLLRYTWSGGEGFGTYRLFFAAVAPGAFRDDRIDPGDVLAVQFADIALQPAATVTVDATRAGSGTVGPAGGRVTVTAADGTVFTLDVPPGGLSRPTTITLAPVTSLTGAPGGLQHVMAVRAAPEGLRFAVPARLTVTPTAPVPARGWFGIGMTGAGAGLELTPAGAANGTVLAAVIQHFSVLGVAIPTLAGLPLTPVTSYTARINAATTQAEYDAIYREWFTAVVDPLLRSGQSDAATLFDAMGQYFLWDLDRLLNTATDATAHTESVRGKTLIANGLRAALARIEAACLAAPSVATAEEALQLQSLAWAYLDDVLQYEFYVGTFPWAPIPRHADLRDLDLASVLSRLCVKAEIVNTTFPGTVQTGVPTTMTVQAGLRFTNGQATATPPLQVAIDATGATPAQRTGLTDATGTFTTSFTPQSGNLTFDVTAALVDGNYPFLSLAPLVATTRLTRTTGGVVVTPSQTTIAPGQSRQFTANQSVTWTVSGGGTITSSGMFTSNSTQGVFFVTATSVVDPTEVGIAQVTVQAPTLGGFYLNVTNAGAAGSAVVNGVTRTFSRPASQAQLVADEIIHHLGAVSVLESAGVDLAPDLQTSVTLNVNLGAFTVGNASVAVPQNGGVCATPSQPNVRLSVGDVTGSVAIQACAGVVEVVAGSITGGARVWYVGAGATAKLKANSAGSVNVADCRGTMTVDAGASGPLDFVGAVNCTASFQGTTFSGHIRIDGPQDSVLGRITASTLNAVRIHYMWNTSLSLQAAAINGIGSAPAFYLRLTNRVTMADLSIASITGYVWIESNHGFKDADANAFLDGIGHSGQRRIWANDR